MSAAREAGEIAGNLSADRAGAGFRAEAANFITTLLAIKGDTPGEQLTDAAKQAGITPPDDRAFGPVYAWLQRKGVIKTVGFCMREKGHGTAGGRIWGLVAQPAASLIQTPCTPTL